MDMLEEKLGEIDTNGEIPFRNRSDLVGTGVKLGSHGWGSGFDKMWV